MRRLSGASGPRCEGLLLGRAPASCRVDSPSRRPCTETGPSRALCSQYSATVKGEWVGDGSSQIGRNRRTVSFGELARSPSKARWQAGESTALLRGARLPARADCRPTGPRRARRRRRDPRSSTANVETDPRLAVSVANVLSLRAPRSVCCAPGQEGPARCRGPLSPAGPMSGTSGSDALGTGSIPTDVREAGRPVRDGPPRVARREHSAAHRAPAGAARAHRGRRVDRRWCTGRWVSGRAAETGRPVACQRRARLRTTWKAARTRRRRWASTEPGEFRRARPAEKHDRCAETESVRYAGLGLSPGSA